MHWKYKDKYKAFDNPDRSLRQLFEKSYGVELVDIDEFKRQFFALLTVLHDRSVIKPISVAEKQKTRRKPEGPPNVDIKEGGGERKPRRKKVAKKATSSEPETDIIEDILLGD